MNKEMSKLRTYLTDHGIKWQDNSTTYLVRTSFKFNGITYSVITGNGSSVRLECKRDRRPPDGYLTAADIIDMIEGRWL